LAIVLQSHCYDISEKPESLPFVDVDLAHWHSNVISAWIEKGIIAWDVNEVGERVFRWDDSISKIEAFAIVMNLRNIQLKHPEFTVEHTYTDAAAPW
jgi:hypothetical protein